MKANMRGLRICLVVCLTLGWALSLPIGSPVAHADDPQPPLEAPGPVIPEALSSGQYQVQEDVELRQALEALDAARRQGPEAVLALRETLHGRALDLVTEEIHAALEELARSAPPLPERMPVSLEEEEAENQVMQLRDAASRLQALAFVDDPREAAVPEAYLPPAEFASPDRPAVDLTVGNGCTYATIAAAITAANPGDRLLLEGNRTFNEHLTINKALILQGGYAGCVSASASRTTIRGTVSNEVVYVVTSPDQAVSLLNINITNGDGSQGGIRLESYSGPLTLNNVDIFGNTGTWGGGLWIGATDIVTGTAVMIYANTATDYGGGVRLYGGRATFIHSNVYNNTAPVGAGVYASLAETDAPELNLPTSADVFNNDALTGDGFGGGVFIRQGALSLSDCSDLYANDAIQGGGAYLITSTLTIEGNCSEIEDNTATSHGGGIYALDSTVNLDNDAELISNTAGYTTDAGSGGGAYLDNTDLWGDKIAITYNTADDFGGGVYATNNSLLDMDLGSYSCLGPHCSNLSGNTSLDLYGGGVYARDGSEVDLRQVFIEANSAQYGGGIYTYVSPVFLYNALIASNDATGSTGDGIRLFTNSSLTGSHNTFANNNAGGAGNGLAISTSSSTLSLTNSIVWGHATSISADAILTVTCSDIQGGYTGAGNISVNPLFVSVVDSDFHLQSGSPVLDRCETGQDRDFDNEIRPVNFGWPATPYDMGADEVTRKNYLPLALRS